MHDSFTIISPIASRPLPVIVRQSGAMRAGETWCCWGNDLRRLQRRHRHGTAARYGASTVKGAMGRLRSTQKAIMAASSAQIVPAGQVQPRRGGEVHGPAGPKRPASRQWPAGPAWSRDCIRRRPPGSRGGDGGGRGVCRSRGSSIRSVRRRDRWDRAPGCGDQKSRRWSVRRRRPRLGRRRPATGERTVRAVPLGTFPGAGDTVAPMWAKSVLPQNENALNTPPTMEARK